MPLMMDPPLAARPDTPISDSASPTFHPAHIAVPLPYSPHTTLHCQITRLETSNLIFLTSCDSSSGSSQTALGSFVYALPNVCSPLLTRLSSPQHIITKRGLEIPAFRSPLYRPLFPSQQHRLRDPRSEDLGPKDREAPLCWMQRDFCKLDC